MGQISDYLLNRIYRFALERLATDGTATMILQAEIAKKCNCGLSTTNTALRTLVRLGYLTVEVRAPKAQRFYRQGPTPVPEGSLLTKTAT